MTRITRLQTTLIEQANAREDGTLSPVPETFSTMGAALDRAVHGLVKKGYVTNDAPASDDAVDGNVLRLTEAGRVFLATVPTAEVPPEEETRAAGFAELATAAAPELRRLWKARRGNPPPPTLSARLMRATLAWDLQAAERGGENPAVRRQWHAVMQRRTEGAEAEAATSGLAQPAALAGTRLLKAWGDEMHEVIV